MANQIDLTKGKGSGNIKTWVVLAAALGAMTFFGVCTPGGRMTSITGPAAKVDGDTVTYAEFRRAYDNMSRRLRSQNPDKFDPQQMRVASRVMDQLVKERVMYKTALVLGIEASEDEVVKLLVEQNAFQDKDGNFNQEFFENYLRNYGYSESSFLEEMSRYQTISKLEQVVRSTTFSPKQAAEFDFKMAETKFEVEYLRFTPVAVKFEVSPEEIKEFIAKKENESKFADYYSKNKKDYVFEEKVQARHILVAHKDSRASTPEAKKRTKDEAKKRAEELLKKVKAKGADFIAIAKKETDEPSGKKSGGDLGFFTRKAMVKEFSDAAFALKPGEISGVIESPFGFHIIKSEAYQEANEIKLEDAKEDIARKLIKKEKTPQLIKSRADEVIKKLATGEDVKDLLKKYGVSWQKTGSFAANVRAIPGLGLNDAVRTAVLSMQKDGEVYQTPVEVAGSQVILKLVKRVDADMSKFDEEKAKQLTSFESLYQGYSYYSDLEQASLEKFKEKIERNDSYLTLDTAQN